MIRQALTSPAATMMPMSTSKPAASHSLLQRLSKPHVAGNIRPMLCIVSGSISAGNMMPESMIDGRKMICDIIVSLELLLTNSPTSVPMDKHAVMKTASLAK